MIAYHFLKADMTASYGNEKPWPVGDTRTLRSNKIIPCKRGYHGSPTLWDALTYAPGPVACLVELDDATAVAHGDPVDKYAARSRRLIAAVNIERELRLFAADCAEHVLWVYEREYPDDLRPRKAIEAARNFANGRIDAAAWAASRDAAWIAAWAASRDAAWTAASDAAWAAAWAASRDAAWAAASDAARTAAWAASRAAARTAASDAARTAEQSWQKKRFEEHFGGLFATELVELAR